KTPPKPDWRLIRFSKSAADAATMLANLTCPTWQYRSGVAGTSVRGCPSSAHNSFSPTARLRPAGRRSFVNQGKPKRNHDTAQWRTTTVLKHHFHWTRSAAIRHADQLTW